MADMETIELPSEAVEAANIFINKLLDAARESGLGDRVLLALIANQLGDIVAIHTLHRCCDPRELIDIMLANFHEGIATRLNDGLPLELRPTTGVH